MGAALGGVVLLALAGCAPRPAPGDAAAAIGAALHEVGVQQIRFRDRHGRYGRSAQELGVVPAPGVRVEIPRIAEDGYLAVGTHPHSRRRCTLRVGEVRPDPAVRAGLACG